MCLFMNPKITLITVTYQSASTLQTTIDSVRRQNCSNIEYIIVDGGSTDDTLDIIRNNQDVVDHWISETDDGTYDAMNKGIGLASGDIVGFLHADDVFASPEVLDRVCQRYEESSFHILYGDLEYVKPEDIKSVVRYWRSGSFRRRQLQRGWMPPHPTVYVDRRFFKKVGHYNLDFRISADYEWLLRALSRPTARVEYLPEVMVRMRMGGLSNGSLKNVVVKSVEDFKALRENEVGGVATLFLKNASKVSQFVRRN
ncbi:MAG: glycosyltransferase family 2 protein [Marinilabiliaceae bacterium]